MLFDPALAYPATPLPRAARRRSPGLGIRGCFQTRIREGKPCGKGKPGSPALQTPSRRSGGPGLASPCRRSGAAAPGPAGRPGHKGRESGERTERAPGRRGAAGSERAGGGRLAGCAALPHPAGRRGARGKDPPAPRGYSQQEAHGDGCGAGPAAAWTRRGSAPTGSGGGGREVRGERRGAGTRPARPPSPPAAPAPPPAPPPSQLRG